MRGFQGTDLARRRRRDRQAPGRLWRGGGGARLRVRRHLGAATRRGLPAAVRSRGEGGCRRRHAVVQRCRRHSGDGARRDIERSPAHALGLRRHRGERLHRGGRIDRAWRRRRRGGGVGAGAEIRRRHRHAGRGLCARPARCAQARPGDDGRHRPGGAAHARAEGTPRPARRPLSPHVSPAAPCQPLRPAGARRRAALGRCC